MFIVKKNRSKTAAFVVFAVFAVFVPIFVPVFVFVFVFVYIVPISQRSPPTRCAIFLIDGAKVRQKNKSNRHCTDHCHNQCQYRASCSHESQRGVN